MEVTTCTGENSFSVLNKPEKLMSDSINELAVALSKAQAKLGAVGKDEKG